MSRRGRAKAQVDHGRSSLRGDFDGADEAADVGGERLPEDFDHDDLGLRNLLADGGGDRGAVAETIDVVVDERAILENSDAAGHAADVRMRRVDAAIDDGDAYALAGEVSEKHSRRSTRSLREIAEEKLPQSHRDTEGAPRIGGAGPRAGRLARADRIET